MPELSWKNPLKEDRKGKIKNLSFKSRVSVIGRIEGDGKHGRSCVPMECGSLLKCNKNQKKFPARPEKHEKNPLRKIEGNKTSKTHVISACRCPEKDRKDSFSEESSRNWDFQHFPIHSSRRASRLKNIFLRIVRFLTLPRLPVEGMKIFFLTCSEKCPFWQIPIHSCQKGKDVAKCDTQEKIFQKTSFSVSSRGYQVEGKKKISEMWHEIGIFSLSQYIAVRKGEKFFKNVRFPHLLKLLNRKVNNFPQTSEKCFSGLHSCQEGETPFRKEDIRMYG